MLIPERLRREAVPLIAALAAACALVFLVLPYMRILSLDFQVMARAHKVLIHGGSVLLDHWVTWGSLVLRYGALPWVLLVVVGLLLRTRRRWTPGAWTFADAPRWATALLALLALLPLSAFAYPFAVALGTWLMVEVYWWIQWQQYIDPIGEINAVAAIWVFVPGTLLFGAWSVWLTLRGRPSGAQRSSWRKWALRAVGLLALVSVVLPNVVLGSVALLHGVRVLPAVGKETLFAERCGKCHEAAGVIFHATTPDEWRYRLDHFKVQESADLTDEEYEDIVTFVTAMRSFSDEWTFRARCQRCHGLTTLTWDDRHPDDWRMITERVARHAPHYYDPAIQHQIVEHLSEEYSSGEEGPGVDGKEYAELRQTIKACNGCHFLSRNAEARRGIDEEEALMLVRRMSKKMVKPLTEEQIRATARAYRRLIADPETFQRLVPHDRAVLSGGPRW